MHIVREGLQEGQHLRPVQATVADSGEVHVDGCIWMFFIPGQERERAFPDESGRCRVPSPARLPLDKATYTFHVTTRRPYMAVANGTLADVLEDGDAVTYIWEMDQRMASYLSTIYVGELAVQGGEDLPGVPLKNYLPPRLAQEAGPLFAAQDEMLAFFADSFGPYPFESYGAATETMAIVRTLEPAALVDQMKLSGLL